MNIVACIFNLLKGIMSFRYDKNKNSVKLIK